MIDDTITFRGDAEEKLWFATFAAAFNREANDQFTDMHAASDVVTARYAEHFADRAVIAYRKLYEPKTAEENSKG